jgi:hypothetical protein
MPKAPLVDLAESKTNKDKGEESNIGETKVTVPKAQKSFAATPKRRSMANVPDVLETVKTLNPTPSRKTTEASKAPTKAETKPAEIEVAATQAGTEARPSEPSEKSLRKLKKTQQKKRPQSNFRLKRLSLLLLKL